MPAVSYRRQLFCATFKMEFKQTAFRGCFAASFYDVPVGKKLIPRKSMGWMALPAERRVMFKKSFWVPYEDSENYPSVTQAMDAIARYCDNNGDSYEFTGNDEVSINGRKYEIYRGYENGSRGNYGIKCKEK